MFITDCLVCEGQCHKFADSISDQKNVFCLNISVITFFKSLHFLFTGLNETLNPIFGLRRLHPLYKMNNHDLKTHTSTVAPLLLGKLRTPKKQPSFVSTCRHTLWLVYSNTPEISLNILILCSNSISS